MALRTNTIEYAFPTNTTTLANNTRLDFAAITINIPNTSSRTFRSAMALVSWTDLCTSTGATISNWTVGCKLGAVAFSDIAETADIGMTDEQMAPWVLVDFTSYFNTNFGAGASQTCQIGVLVNQAAGDATLGVNNISVKLILTYEFDDSGETTGIKTVRIPIESITGASPTTLTEIGTSQIPNLGTFLPETSKTFRDIFFEMQFNEQNASTTDMQLGLGLDSEAEALSGNLEAALQSARTIHYIWKRTDMTTNATHAFKQRLTVAARGHMFGAVLVVTYEYATSSTTIMNSLMLPFVFESPRIPQASGDADRKQFKFFIEEPTTITLAQSGVWLSWSQSVPPSGFNFRAGGQTFRAYTAGTGTPRHCGGMCLIQRIDSGGAQGAGVSIARGENTITLDLYTTDASNFAEGASGFVMLNYTSGKAANGPFNHNHTIALFGNRMSGAGQQTLTFAPNIPETDYWANSVGVFLPYMTRNDSAGGVDLLIERASGEAAGAGWATTRWKLLCQGEIGICPVWGDVSAVYDRHPTDPDATRMALETSRTWNFWVDLVTVSGLIQSMALITYHAITFSVSGASTGHTGSGNPVKICRADTGERLYETTTDASGNWGVTGYDSVLDYFAECRISETLNDRTGNWKFT